ncbi:hypothetical protein Npun_R1351 [Nostoc punctiforme PCC 73102]|uniref:Uncharacterized protein n=2 Tax=Nostoc punctiforme TaxID=272131 RepID=B2IYH5_NOSP7|nr:hypothetical protein Npun_R1351 [Nostoc punctiforme PCC 73102]
MLYINIYPLLFPQFMNNKAKLLTLASLTLAVSFLSVSTVVAQAKLTNKSKLSINGIGEVKVGMTVSQAAKAAGTKLAGDSPNNSCYYVKPQNEPKNLLFMVTKGRISRVDVRQNTQITTLKGGKIGDTEAQIKSLYPGQIKVTPHKYVQGGHYLTFIPKDRSNQNYRVVFETDGKRVTQFRSGKLPEVEFVEGCS